MAKQTTIDLSSAHRKQELISQLANSRRKISNGRGAIKKQLNPKTQISSLFSKNPKAAVIGSAVLGLAVTSMLRGKKRRKLKGARSKRSRGLVMTLAGWGLTLAKPSLKALLIRQATTLATKQISQRQNSLQSSRQNRQDIHRENS